MKCAELGHQFKLESTRHLFLLNVGSLTIHIHELTTENQNSGLTKNTILE